MASRIREQVNHRINIYLDQAETLLSSGMIDDKDVHDLRVFCKKLRGLLRLFRKCGQDEILKPMDAALRDASRSLSPSRDAQVLSETLRSLLSEKSPANEDVIALLAHLDQQHANVMTDLDIRPARRLFKTTRQHWRTLSSAADDGDLEKMLLRSCRKVCRNGEHALAARDPQHLHAWRKDVKYLYYQLDVLGEEAWLRQQYQLLKKLGTVLGDIHDLDELQTRLALENIHDTALLKRLRNRRSKLLGQARKLYRPACVKTRRLLRNQAREDGRHP